LTRHLYRLSIAIRSPVMCQGLAPAGLGVDASFIRDEQDRPILPADHVKGLIRAALAHRRPDLVESLFGPRAKGAEAEMGESNVPVRGRVFLSDLATDDCQSPGYSTRIAISATTGAAEPGMLQVCEMIAPPGKVLTFTGQLVVYEASGVSPQGVSPESDKAALEEALGAIPAVGAFKSIGFGELAAKPELSEQAPPARRMIGLDSERVALEIAFDRPVLIDARRLADNVFTSSAIVPGAVVKGALAMSLGRQGHLAPALSRALSAIGISQALPLDVHGRAMMQTPPRSLIIAEGEEGMVVGCGLFTPLEGGALIGGEPGLFSNDWKPKGHRAAAAAMNWTPSRLDPTVQRTRVAVGEDGVAEDQMLFVHQALPCLHDDATTKAGGKMVQRRWRLEVSRNGVPADAWSALLGALAEGLDGIGKTDARLSVVNASPTAAPDAPDPMNGPDGAECWAVTLASPTLMIDPDESWDAAVQYQDYWNWALRRLGCDGRAVLTSWFTHERLHGGYEAMRRSLFGAGRYQPLLLTSPGSVFLLTGPPELRNALRKALLHGLPARPPKASGKDVLTWKDTVFVPENGYGEIAFHHEAHERLRGEVTYV